MLFNLPFVVAGDRARLILVRVLSRMDFLQRFGSTTPNFARKSKISHKWRFKGGY